MMKTIETPADWSELPGDLLGQIIDKFISTSSLSAYIRFGAVCSSWRLFFTTENYKHIDELSNRFLVLLFPNKCDDNIKINKNTRSFYSVSEKKVYNFQLPVPYRNNCYGSSHGWLITVEYDDQKNYGVKLLNPFRSFNNEITLPPLSKHLYYLHYGTGGRYRVPFTKLVLSADPWPSSSSKPAEDVIVMGIYHNNWIGYCRVCDQVWTAVPCTWGYYNILHDVIYYKGLFYVVTGRGTILALDFSHDLQKLKVTLISPNTRNNDNQLKKPAAGERVEIYLMECSGDLLQVFRVCRRITTLINSTIQFEVYKIDWGQFLYDHDHDHDLVRRVRVRDLNGFSLFLGVNASISVKAADFFPGCKPDCIYFTGGGGPALVLESLDIGVFCLLDESLEPHNPFPWYTENASIPAPIRMQLNKAFVRAPIWIQPTQISALINLITNSYEKST